MRGEEPRGRSSDIEMTDVLRCVKEIRAPSRYWSAFGPPAVRVVSPSAGTRQNGAILDCGRETALLDFEQGLEVNCLALELFGPHRLG